MNWCNKYIGIPYQLHGRTIQGADCWGLVRLVYSEQFNIELPSFDSTYTSIQDPEIERMLMSRESWSLSKDKNIGDVIVFNIMGSMSHVGVYLGDNKFLHAREGYSACIERLDTGSWKHRVEGFYKYTPNVTVSAKPHPLRTQRIDAVVPAGANLEQVAQILSKDVSKELDSTASIVLDGVLIPKDKWSTTYVAPGRIIEYRALPAGGNGGSGRMMAMLAITIAVSLAMPGIGAALVEAGGAAMGATTAAGVTTLTTSGMLAASAIGMGLNMAGMLLVNSIFPVRVPTEVTQGKSMLMMQGGQNAGDPYGSIPVVLGKFRYTPPLGAVTYSETSGKNSYLRMLLVWGYGPLQISDLRIGATSLDNYEEVEYETITGYDDAPEDLTRFRSIYGKDVCQEAPNVKLESFQYDLTSISRSNNVVTVTTAESHYFTSGDTVTISVGYNETIEVLSSSEGGGSVISFTGNYVQTEIITGEITVTGGSTFTIPSTGADETLSADGYVKKSPWTEKVLTKESDSITVSLSFPSGLRKVWTDNRDGGKSYATTFRGQVQVRQIDPDTMQPITNWGDIEKIFNSQSINLQPAWFNIDSDAELEPVYRWTRVSINENNVLQVRTGAYTAAPGSNPSGTLLLRQQQAAFGIGETYVALPEYGQSEEPLWDICMYGNSVYSTVDKRGTGTAGVTGIGLTVDNLTATFASGEVTRAQSETLYYGGEGEPYCKRKDAFVVNVKFNVPRGLHEVRVRRTNRSKIDFENAQHYHDCYLNTITGYSTERPVINPKDVSLAMTALRIKASNQLNGNIDGITGTVQTICYDYTNRNATNAVRSSNVVTVTTAVEHKISVGDSVHLHSMLDASFDGKFKVLQVIDANNFTYAQTGSNATSSGAKIWVIRPTRNPASLLRHVLQHPANAQKVLDSQIDLDGLVSWHSYCRTNKFMYDAVARQSSVLDTLRDIGSAGRGSPTLIDGKWGIVVDKPRTSPVQFFSPHNSWGFEGVRALVKMPHAFRVSFNNSERGYAPDEMLVYNDGYSSSNATQFESLTLPGVTTRDAVFKHARFHLAQLKLRPESYTINADIEHLVCNRGDLVRVVHDVPMWGIGSGRISRLIPYVAGTSGTKIVLSDPMPLDNTTSYVARIRKEDGSSLVKEVRPVVSPIETVDTIADLFNLTYSNVSVEDRIFVSEDSVLLVVLPSDYNDYLYNFTSTGGVKLGYASETVNIQSLPSKQTATTTQQAITMANDLSTISGYAQTAGTTGGTSYPVYWVTNSEDSITTEGSLRWAIQQASTTNGGIVLFEPTGKFDVYLSSQIEIPTNITIDAPGRNANIWAASDITRFKVVSDNVIIRRLQFGATANAATSTLRDSVWIEPSMADKVWINECSFQWSGDGCVDMTTLVELTSDCRVTVSNCYFNNHDKGSLIGSLACYQEDDQPAWCSTALSSQTIRLFVTMQKNFWNSVGQRQPKVVSQAFVDSINNVVRMAPYVRNTGDTGACYGLFTATGGMARSTNDLYGAIVGSGYSGVDASVLSYVPPSNGVLAIEGKGAVDINGSVATNGVTLNEREAASVITAPYSITPIAITNTTNGIIDFINTIEVAAGASAKSPRYAASSINLPDGYYDTLELVTFSAGAYVPYNATNSNINPNDLILFGINNEESVELIVQSIEPSQNMVAKLTLVDYSPDIYNSDTETIPEFNSNITLPPVLLAKTILTKPTIRQIISDESVMTIASPGQYIYNIKVSFTNPQTLPDNVIGVQGQIDFAEDTSLDWSSTITFKTEDRAVMFDDVQEGGQYKIRLRYVTDAGSFGPWTTTQTHTVVGKTTPPLQVSPVEVTLENTKLRLDWPDNPEIDIVLYEIRDTDSNWGQDGFKFKGRTSSCLVDSPNPGQTATYYIKAIDCTGLYSTTARAIPFDADIMPSVSDIRYSFNDTSTTSATVTLSWDNVIPQQGLSKYELSYGTSVIYADSNSITLPANWVGNRYFTIVVIDSKGYRSEPFIKAVPKLAPSSVVAKIPQVVGTQILLSWNQTIKTTLPVAGYEVRTSDSDWGSAGFLFKGSVTEVSVNAPAVGTTGTWYIKAFDTDNVYSVNAITMSITPSSVYEVDVASIKEIFEDTSLTSSSILLTWEEVSPQFGLKNYTISYTVTTETGLQTISKNVSTNNITLPADWLGDREFTFQVTDLNNNTSTGVPKTIRTQAPNAVTEIRSQVVDNNVLLYWTLPVKTTLPIQDVIIKKGPVWETAELIGSKKGEFTTIQEVAADSYTYWIAVRDTDDNISEAKSIGVKVSAPPDFVFYGAKQSTFNQTLSSAKLVNNTVVLPVNTAETWQSHFASRTWDSPQDQISAGYPLFLQPSNNSGYYEEVFDFEVTVPSTQITVDYSGTVVSGSPAIVVTIETSDNGTTWSAPITNTSIFASQFQYVRVRFKIDSGDNKALYTLKSLSCRLDSKTKADSGSKALLSTDSLGTYINFNKEFLDVTSIILSPSGTTALSAVYDFQDQLSSANYSITSNVLTVNATGHNLVAGQSIRLNFSTGGVVDGIYTVLNVVDANNFTVAIVSDNTSGTLQMYPQSFRAYLFDNTGTRVSGDVSWSVRGY